MKKLLLILMISIFCGCKKGITTPAPELNKQQNPHALTYEELREIVQKIIDEMPGVEIKNNNDSSILIK